MISILLFFISISNAVEINGTCGENCQWIFTNETQTLVIMGQGEMNNYIQDSNPEWYEYRKYIKTLTVGEGITSIGEYAFNHHIILETITLPSTLVNIKDSSFSMY